jgi:microsomal dipeptidase-like Zn-dependent dipeptidase
MGALVEALAARGVDEQTMAKIAGANFVRMLPEG